MRLISLFVPMIALIACSAAPDDASRPAELVGQTHEDLQSCLSSSCQFDDLASTPQNLIDLGCSISSEVISYVPEYVSQFGQPEGSRSPASGWFVMCPDSAESSGITPSCSYCLGAAPSGFFWYEWFSEAVRPCPSGCLHLPEPPITRLP